MSDPFLRLSRHISSGQPCMAYAKPGSNALTFVFQINSEGKEVNGEGFIFAPFAQGSTVFVSYKDAETVTIPLEVVDNQVAAANLQVESSHGREAFVALAKKSIAAIREGHFKKLVISRMETVQVEDLEMVTVFKRLLGKYPNAFRYCFYSPETGLWMGATPEQLLKIERNTLHTVALAGTRLNNQDVDIAWPEKERLEQQFVTDYLIKELTPFSLKNSITAPYTAIAGNIQHIKTDISAQISKGIDTQQIINALHPTPAVCGLPKASALNYIVENEGYSREYYAGYLGEINHDFVTGESSTDLFVNLRCMKVEGNTAHLYIGCGITADSDPEKEYQETVNKSMTMKQLFS